MAVTQSLIFSNPNTSFGFKPIITPRLILQPVLSSDWQNFKHLYENPAVMKGLYGSTAETVISIDGVKALVRSYAESWNYNPNRLVAPLKIGDSNGQFIGFIDLEHGRWCLQPGHVEMRVMILQKEWNKGYAKEAINAVLKELELLACNGYKLKDHSLTSVIATVPPDNYAALHILEKLEFKNVGITNRLGEPRCFFHKGLTLVADKKKFKPEDLFLYVSPMPSKSSKLRSRL